MKWKYPRETEHDNAVVAAVETATRRDVFDYDESHDEPSTQHNWNRRFMHYINVLIARLFVGKKPTRSDIIMFYLRQNKTHLNVNVQRRALLDQFLNEP